jgi:hypothetical protein
MAKMSKAAAEKAACPFTIDVRSNRLNKVTLPLRLTQLLHSKSPLEFPLTKKDI